MHNLSIYYNYLCDSMQFSNALRCNEHKKDCCEPNTRQILRARERPRHSFQKKKKKKKIVLSQPPIQYENSFVEKCERDQYILWNHVVFFSFLWKIQRNERKWETKRERERRRESSRKKEHFETITPNENTHTPRKNKLRKKLSLKFYI